MHVEYKEMEIEFKSEMYFSIILGFGVIQLK